MAFDTGDGFMSAAGDNFMSRPSDNCMGAATV